MSSPASPRLRRPLSCTLSQQAPGNQPPTLPTTPPPCLFLATRRQPYPSPPPSLLHAGSLSTAQIVDRVATVQHSLCYICSQTTLVPPSTSPLSLSAAARRQPYHSADSGAGGGRQAVPRSRGGRHAPHQPGLYGETGGNLGVGPRLYIPLAHTYWQGMGGLLKSLEAVLAYTYLCPTFCPTLMSHTSCRAWASRCTTCRHSSHAHTCTPHLYPTLITGYG